jgi:SAM-dependent methyltransferase
MRHPPTLSRFSTWYDGFLYEKLIAPQSERLQTFLTVFAKKGGTALEVGCGVGALSFKLAAKCSKVVGVDISQRMISYAERKKLKLGVTICCKSEFPIVAEEIPQALGGEFWLPPHERVPHSVALSVKDQQVAVVHEAVDQSRGHGLVEEDIHPPAELQVCGDEHAAFLVAG